MWTNPPSLVQIMKIIRNKAVVATRTHRVNTYKKHEYLWGIVSHEERVHQKDIGYDLYIRLESKPKRIYIQFGDNKPKKI